VQRLCVGTVEVALVDDPAIDLQEHAADLLELITGDGPLQRLQAGRIRRDGTGAEGQGACSAEQGQDAQD